MRIEYCSYILSLDKNHCRDEASDLENRVKIFLKTLRGEEYYSDQQTFKKLLLKSLQKHCSEKFIFSGKKPDEKLKKLFSYTKWMLEQQSKDDLPLNQERIFDIITNLEYLIVNVVECSEKSKESIRFSTGNLGTIPTVLDEWEKAGLLKLLREQANRTGDFISRRARRILKKKNSETEEQKDTVQDSTGEESDNNWVLAIVKKRQKPENEKPFLVISGKAVDAINETKDNAARLGATWKGKLTLQLQNLEPPEETYFRLLLKATYIRNKQLEEEYGHEW